MNAFQSIGVHVRAFTTKRFVSLTALAGVGFASAILAGVGVYLATIPTSLQALPALDRPTAAAPKASVVPAVLIVPAAPIMSVAHVAPGVDLEKALPMRDSLVRSKQSPQGQQEQIHREKQEVQTERVSRAAPSLQKVTPVAQAVRSARLRSFPRESDLPAADPLRVALPSMNEMERACNRATLQESMPPSFCSCDAGEFDQLECHVSASVASGALR